MSMQWGYINESNHGSLTGEECKLCVCGGGGRGVEEVEKLKYLGVMISGDGGCDDEIGQRIGAAARVVGAMQKEVLDRRELQKKARMRLFNAIVISTLLYAHEMWTT